MDFTHAASSSSTTPAVVPSPFKSLSFSPIPAFSKYEFRPAARESAKNNWVTWLDQDKSGNYDPNGCQSPQPPAPKRRRSTSEDKPHVSQHKKAKISSWQQGRYIGLSYPVAFKFITLRGRAQLKAIGRASDNWPEYQSETNSGEQNSFWSSSADTTATAQSCDLSGPYNLRNRLIGTCGVEQHGNGISSIEEITLGHPAARGCKACFDLRFPCDLLLEGSKYPCRACVEDGEECELILQPAQKRACEGCRRRRIVCSYREEGDHSLPCLKCAESDEKCIAGPKSGRTRTGPSLDQALSQQPKTVPLSWPKFVSCMQSRRNKKRCSLKNKHQAISCNQCHESGIDCTSEPLPPLAADGTPGVHKHNLQQTQVKDQNTKGQKTQSAREKPPGERNSNAVIAKTKFITTQLTHPVTFNYMPSDGNSPLLCHWCDDMMYGLLGLGAVRVEVIDHQDDQGYTEVKGGHAAQGHLPSRMCGSCTLERLMIAACSAHDMQPLPGMDAATFDLGSIADYMMPGTAASAPFAWCSVCPSPAFYGCRQKTAPAEDESEADRVLLGEVDGCGLRLCGSCALKLADEHDGILERLIDRLKLDAGNAEFALRADAEFLLPRGELFRRIALDLVRKRNEINK